MVIFPVNGSSFIENIRRDVDLINQISIVPNLPEIICRMLLISFADKALCCCGGNLNKEEIIQKQTLM